MRRLFFVMRGVFGHIGRKRSAQLEGLLTRLDEQLRPELEGAAASETRPLRVEEASLADAATEAEAEEEEEEAELRRAQNRRR